MSQEIAYRRSCRLDQVLRWLTALVVLGSIALFITSTISAPFTIEADHRIAPSLALIRGYSLYYSKTGGPVLSTLYGPFVAFLYLPAVFSITPISAVRVATLLTFFYFLAPALLLCGKLRLKRPDKRFVGLIGSFALIMALIMLHPALQRAFSSPHADAPALGLGALAVLFTIPRDARDLKWREIVAASLCSACSVLSKQNMAPLPLILAAWIFSREGRAKGIGFCLSGLLFGAAVIAFVANSFSTLPAIWFNLVIIPTHQPYSKLDLFPAISLLIYQSAALAAIPLAAVARRSTRSINLSKLTREQPLLLVILCGAGLMITSLLGYLKAGGNLNALSPTLYFLAVAMAVELSPGLDGLLSPSGHHRSQTSRTLAAVVLGAAILSSYPSLTYTLIHLPKGLDSPIETAYLYEKAHPGAIYFPQFPLAVMLAHGPLYHFAWGLQDREQAGYPVSSEQFLRYTPAAKVMAVVTTGNPWDAAILSHCGREIANHEQPVLQGFKLCTVKERDGMIVSGQNP